MLNINKARQITENYNCILSCNVLSFNQSHSRIKNLINQLKIPQVILLQEIWHPKISINIPNYQKPLQSLRQKKRGGGLSIHIRDDIDFEEYIEINNMKLNHIEKLAVIVKNTKKFLLINIYRPPNENYNESLVELGNILEKATNSQLPFTLIGDFNIDLASKNHIARKYTELIQTFNCIQIVSLPTRISSQKRSLIDHCICSNDFLIRG